MPSWSDIYNEVAAQSDPTTFLNTKRLALLEDISIKTGRNTIAYYSGWLKEIGRAHV